MTAKRKSATTKAEYSFICAEVKDYSVRVSGEINYEIHDRRYAHPECRVFRYETDLDLRGTISYPEDRAGDEINISIWGHNPQDGHFSATLDEFHVRDAAGLPKYRKRGDRSDPVYESPESVGFIERRRGTRIWSGAAYMPPAIVSDILTLLVGDGQAFLMINELKIGRRRAIRSITLQNRHPENE
ncbi:hypothetical protein Maes01_02775 [Microbulbifer aestuariivivens]|uniref:Uncharacterized protein n=1 Tax=Microbulbifer aestuariivivens TaxID=1908308 RepID=A0ABP9WVM6_9GAMM